MFSFALPGLFSTGYRAGGLQDSDTEEECWSDNEVAPKPPVRPREKPLSRSQSLRVVRRKPLVREVSALEGQCDRWQLSYHAHATHCMLAFSPQGNLALHEGQNPEKDDALGHGQLDSAESGHLTSPASRGPFAATPAAWAPPLLTSAAA